MDDGSGISKKTIAVVVVAFLLLLLLVLRACSGSEEPATESEVPGAPVTPTTTPQQASNPFLEDTPADIGPVPEAPTRPESSPISVSIDLVMERSPGDPLWLPVMREADESPVPEDPTDIPGPTVRERTISRIISGDGPREEDDDDDDSGDESVELPDPAPGPGSISVVTTDGRRRLCDEIIKFSVEEMDRYGWRFFISETSPPNGLTCRVTLHPVSESRSEVNRNAWTLGGVLVSHLRPMVRDTIACRPIGASQQCRPELHQSAQANAAEFTVGDRLNDGILPVRQTILGVSTSDHSMLIWVY